MAIKRPTSGLTPQDLEAGQFLIEGGEQGAVTNIPGMASAPRPVGVSTAPRPTTFDSFAPVARPSEESSRLLRRMTAEQKGGGPVSARERKVQAFETAEAAPAKALADEARRKALAEEKERLLRIPGEQDIEQAKIEAGVAEKEVGVSQFEAETERERVRNELETATLGRESAERLAQERVEADVLIGRIQQSGVATPEQQAEIVNIEGANRERDTLVKGIADLQTVIGQMGETDATKALQKTLTDLVDATNQRATDSLNRLKDSDAGAEATETSEVSPDVDALPPATASNAVNVNGDGSTDAEDVKEINDAIRFVKQMKQAEKRGLPAFDDDTNQTELIRAQGIVKAYTAKANEDGKKLVNG